MRFKRVRVWLQQAIYRIPATDTHCWQTKLELLRLSRDSRLSSPPVRRAAPSYGNAPAAASPPTATKPLDQGGTA